MYNNNNNAQKLKKCPGCFEKEMRKIRPQKLLQKGVMNNLKSNICGQGHRKQKTSCSYIIHFVLFYMTIHCFLSLQGIYPNRPILSLMERLNQLPWDISCICLLFSHIFQLTFSKSHLIKGSTEWILNCMGTGPH